MVNAQIFLSVVLDIHHYLRQVTINMGGKIVKMESLRLMPFPRHVEGVETWLPLRFFYAPFAQFPPGTQSGNIDVKD